MPVGRAAALVAAVLVSLLAVSGAASSPPPQRGGTVFMPGGPEPACITPYITVCLGDPVTFADFLPDAIFAGAYQLRPDLTWNGQLVSQLESTEKPPYTLTLHIRPEARWSDGVPVSAADFVFTYRTLRTYRTQISALDRVAVDLMDRVSALGPKTVRIVLSPHATGFWRGLAFRIVLPRHVLKGEDYLEVWKKRIDDPRTGEPIGSGPFLVSGWKRGKQLTLVRNPGYWGSHAAYLKRIILRFDELGTPSEALASGRVDLVPLGLRPEDAPSLRRLPGIRVVSGLGLALEQIAINVRAGGNPLLRKRLVRQALAYGLDRHAIVNALFRRTLPGQRVADSLVYLNSSPYYRPNWSGYRYRPVTARRLLERVGCRRGADRIYVCAGEKLSLRFVTRADVPSRVTSLELAAGQLRRAGIEIVPTFVSAPVMTQILAGGEYDLLQYSQWYNDPPDTYALAPPTCGKDYLGWTRYCRQADMAELLRADRTLEGRERARAVNRADAMLAEDVPWLPLYWVPQVAAVKSSLRGLVFHPGNPFWQAERWWVVPER